VTKFLVIFLIIVLLILVIPFFYKQHAIQKNQLRFKTDYKPFQDIVVDRGGETVVILLHGFSTGPQEFLSLLPYLDKKKVSYVIPNLIGHNQPDTKIFETITYDLWEKQILELYKKLAKQYKYVDVIGFSNGGNLALKLSTQKDIRNLVLINSFSYPNQFFRTIYGLSQFKIMNFIFNHLIGYVPMDPDMKWLFYQYPYVPFNSLIQILALQASIDFSKVSAKEMYFIFASQDDLSDYVLLTEEKLAPLLKTENILILEKSSHRALEENELDKITALLDRIY